MSKSQTKSMCKKAPFGKSKDKDSKTQKDRFHYFPQQQK